MAPRLSRRTVLRSSLATPIIASAQGATPEASQIPTGPQFMAAPQNVRFDGRFCLYIFNVDYGAEVTISAEWQDAGDETWRSSATYLVNSDEYLSTSMHEPRSDDFIVADTMAFIWAAKSDGFRRYVPPFEDSERIIFRASIEGEVLETTVTRHYAGLAGPPLDIELQDGIVGRFYRGQIEKPGPAILIIGGSEGGLSDYLESTARSFAANGFHALTVAYFGLPGLPQFLSQIPIEYFGAAIAWMRRRMDIDSSRIGMMGYSRGGEAALLTATHFDTIRAVVCVNGSGAPISEWRGIVDPDYDYLAAWTWEGRDVPTLSPNGSVDEAMATAIPIEDVNGPVLMVVGEADRLWHSLSLGDIARQRWGSVERSYADQLLAYPGLGQILMDPYQPVGESIGSGFGGTLTGNGSATGSAWTAILQHFRTALGS